MNDAGTPVPASRGRSIACAVLVAAAVLAWWLPVDPDVEERLWRTYRVTDAIRAIAVTAIAAAGLYVVLGGGETRRRVFRVILATLSIGFCLLLVEIPAVVLRHDYAKTFGTNPADTWLQIASGINRADPELIHVHNPNDTFEGDVAGNLTYLGIPGGKRYRVSLRYDRNGFRNDRDLDRADVVVIGDSFVEAAIVPAAETASRRLEEKLGTTVANLGQEAYGLRQELAVLRRFGLPLRPRAVVWFLFGGNDLRDVPDYEEALRSAQKGRPARPLRDRAFIGNALLALSSFTTPARSEPSREALANSGTFTREDGTRERVYFDGGDEYDAHSWQVATETLAEAARLCREADAKFVVVYVTRKLRVYRGHVEFEPGSELPALDPGDLPSRMAQWTARQGIAFVDLSPALEREVAAGRHPFLVDDVHWNGRGHEIAAEEVALALKRLGWSAAEKKER